MRLLRSRLVLLKLRRRQDKLRTQIGFNASEVGWGDKFRPLTYDGLSPVERDERAIKLLSIIACECFWSSNCFTKSIEELNEAASIWCKVVSAAEVLTLTPSYSRVHAGVLPTQEPGQACVRASGYEVLQLFMPDEVSIYKCKSQARHWHMERIRGRIVPGRSFVYF